MDTLNGVLEIDFDGKLVMYERMEVTDLQPAYAISVHKSQGSSISCYFPTPQAALHDVAKKPSLYRANSGKKKSNLCWRPSRLCNGNPKP